MSVTKKGATRRAFFDGSTLILLVFVGGLIAYAAMSPYGSIHMERIWNMIRGQDSNMGFLEDPITSIHEEFMRRSPELQGVYDEYVQCAGQDMDLVSCSLEEIEERKTDIVREQWPSIFDRLVLDVDWGTDAQSLSGRATFFYALDFYGAEKFRNICYPEIRFFHFMDSDMHDYTSGTFTCT